MPAPFGRVVLTTDIPQEGYELEFLSGIGDNVVAVSVAATSGRQATDHEVLSVRKLARAR